MTEQRKTTSRRNPQNETSIKIFNMFLMVAIIVCGVYYVALVNDLTIKGIKVQELKQEVSSLKEDNRHLNVKVTSLKSYQNVAPKTEEMKMVSVNNIDYIRVNQEVLAQK